MTYNIQAHPTHEFDRLAIAVREMPISNADDRKERLPKALSRRLFPKTRQHASTPTLCCAFSAGGQIPLLRHTQFPPPPLQDLPPSDLDRERTAERDKGDYALYVRGTDSSATHDSSSDEHAEPSLKVPVERERKPYLAKEGTGKIYDDKANTRSSSILETIIDDSRTTKLRAMLTGVDTGPTTEGSSSASRTQASNGSRSLTLTANYDSVLPTRADPGESQRDIDYAVEEFVQPDLEKKHSNDRSSKSEETSSQRFPDPKLSGSSGEGNSSPKSPSRSPKDRASRTKTESPGRNELFVFAENELPGYQLNNYWSAIQWIRSNIGRIFRPKVVSGYRRIEWTCVESP